MSDEQFRVVRKMDTLEPLYVQMAKQIEGEYDYWIAEERRLRDAHTEADEQVRIREGLLSSLRELM